MQLQFDYPPLEMQRSAETRSAYDYLYRLVETLQGALAQVHTETVHEALQTITGNASGSITEATAKTARELKSLIIKSADTVEREMDELREEMHGTYLAVSEFGTYQEQIDREIQETAEGTFNRWIQSTEMTNLVNAVTALNTYVTESEAYITSGLLYYDDYNLPVYGIAIGDNLKRVVVDGEEILRKENLACVITSEKISFYIHGQECAYISNNSLYITGAYMSSRFGLGKLTAIVDSTGVDWYWEE